MICFYFHHKYNILVGCDVFLFVGICFVKPLPHLCTLFIEVWLLLLVLSIFVSPLVP